jgi:HEAT repeat protein
MTITPESVQPLLDSPDHGDRLRGINQLRLIDPQLAFEMIKPLVKDANARVRYAAVSQLDTLAQHDPEAALELLRDRLYHDAEVDVKAAAADALGGLKLTAAFEDLQQAYYNTSEWLIQVSIVATLGEFGDPRGFDILKEALAHENELIKMMAVGALGELGDSRAIPLLVPFVSDADWQIRYRLAQSLGRLGGSEAQAILEKLTEDEFEVVAQEAQRNLNL